MKIFDQSLFKSHIPIWDHLYYNPEMKIENWDQLSLSLKISDSTSELEITKASTIHPGLEGWMVDWELIENKEEGTKMGGRVRYSEEQLKNLLKITGSTNQGIIAKKIYDAFKELFQEALLLN